jgi:hypothetical protein
MPYLVHATIRWDHCPDFTPREWLDRQGRLLDKLGRWLRRNGVKVSFLWVREVGRLNGEHTHLLLHLPPEHWAACKEFLLTAGDFERGRNVTGEAVVLKGGDFGMRTPRMRAGALRYLLKSVDPDAIARAPADDGGTRPLPEALGIRVDRDRLPVSGKRCGTSYSIGATMRRNFRWRELRTVAELRDYLNP